MWLHRYQSLLSYHICLHLKMAPSRILSLSKRNVLQKPLCQTFRQSQTLCQKLFNSSIYLAYLNTRHHLRLVSGLHIIKSILLSSDHYIVQSIHSYAHCRGNKKKVMGSHPSKSCFRKPVRFTSGQRLGAYHLK